MVKTDANLKNGVKIECCW